MEKDISGQDFQEVGNPRLRRNMGFKDLIEMYGEIYGFMSGHLYDSISLIRSIDPPQLRVISFTANLVSTGLRSIFAQLIREGVFNVVFTTCGTLDHDIARSSGGKYLKGSFMADDAELYEKGYHRLGNIFIPLTDYGPKVEEFVMKLAEEASRDKQDWPLYELLWKAGSMISDEDSILRAAWEKRIPIFVPGWPDGAFGTSIFMARQKGLKVNVNYFLDMQELASIFFREQSSFALIIGGGISKHHTIWWSQFMDGLDNVIYITTAVEYDGSLSGAHPREAITWGKVKARANKIVVYGDATVILPLIAYELLDNWSWNR
ncbi:MAG: deoxyhypusine synthase [Desulfurococcales archaeon]|nr:deoxyhypusine synthase [Desulfurococcales archaeon]